MQILEIIQEARRNPELNPKLSAYDQLEARYNATDDYIDADTKNLFANFLGIDKIGVNPNPSYSATPLGVYGYPVKFIIEKMERTHSRDMSTLSYATAEPYINLFNIDYTNILNIDQYPSSQKYFDQIATIYSQKTTKSFDQSQELIKNIINDSQNIDQGLYGDIKFLCKKLFDRTVWPHPYASRLTTLLKKLGFDGVYDSGYGYIHPNEPSQLVVFNPKVIKNNQRILNTLYVGDVDSSDSETLEFYMDDMISHKDISISYANTIEEIKKEINNLSTILKIPEITNEVKSIIRDEIKKKYNRIQYMVLNIKLSKDQIEKYKNKLKN